MRALTILTMVVLLALAACTGPLYPGNETNATNDSTDYTPVDLPDMNMSDELPSETPDEADEPADDGADDAYAARIEAVEGQTIELDTRATDPDGDEVTLAFGEPFSEDGIWETEIGDAGEYVVEVVASDGQDETRAEILVTVLAANSAPEISGPDTIRVEEGETVDLGVFTIVDPDGDEFITSYAGWMSGSEYETDFDDAGEHEVRIIAEDTEGNVAEETVLVIVENVNRAPELDIEDRSLEVVEGETVVIEASADDPDGDQVTISYEEPFDENGEWATEEGDAGEYRITVTATDGDEQVERTVTVEVLPANQPPVIEISPRVTVQEGETVDLESRLTVEDPDGDDVDVAYSGWMTSGTYTTTFDDAGTYAVTITATDSEGNSAEETVEVVVENVNRPPVFIRTA